METSTVCFVLVFILRSTISKNTDVNINVTISSKPDSNNGYSPKTDTGMCKDLLIPYEFKKSSLFNKWHSDIYLSLWNFFVVLSDLWVEIDLNAELLPFDEMEKKYSPFYVITIKCKNIYDKQIWGLALFQTKKEKIRMRLQPENDNMKHKMVESRQSCKHTSHSIGT